MKDYQLRVIAEKKELSGELLNNNEICPSCKFRKKTPKCVLCHVCFGYIENFPRLDEKAVTDYLRDDLLQFGTGLRI